MFKFWKSRREQSADKSSQEKNVAASTESAEAQPLTGEITWSDKATQALEQAVGQAPVPAMMKGRVKKELQKAAEDITCQAGRVQVTAEDLMNGLLSKLPAGLRQQVEQAAKQGPEGLKNLEKKLRRG